MQSKKIFFGMKDSFFLKLLKKKLKITCMVLLHYEQNKKQYKNNGGIYKFPPQK